ncbi:Tol-Pal system protein TolB [subsurface metagenome]
MIMNARGFKVNAWLCIFIVAVMLLIFGCGKEDGIIIKPFETSGECEPAFSSDGGYIAYTKEGEYEIWLFEITTEESEYLTDGSLADWSPDGNEIVYVNNRDIYKINVETKEIQQLTTWGSCFFPDWSPDGELLAFDCTIGNSDSSGIWIMNLTHGATKHIGLGRKPDWNQNCDKITYIGRSADPTHHEYDVWITDTSGIDPIRLTSSGATSPAFSPDGSKMAYVGETRIENELPWYNVYNIWVMDTNGTNKTQLTAFGPGDKYEGAWDPAWSSDGNQIVYVNAESFEKERVIEIVYHLWIMDADRENKRQLTGRETKSFGCK